MTEVAIGWYVAGVLAAFIVGFVINHTPGNDVLTIPIGLVFASWVLLLIELLLLVILSVYIFKPFRRFIEWYENV